MGVEARYQALPENCDFFRRLRHDREFAECVQFFNKYARGQSSLCDTDPQYIHEFRQGALELEQRFPGLASRYYYGVSRCYDQLHYLLSPWWRGEPKWVIDHSLIREAIYGIERLHPQAIATQGRPLGLVSAIDVPVLAEYLSEITKEMLHEHYDPPRMVAQGVYKIHDTDDESRFEWAWDEFCGMKTVYQQASTHGEAIVTVID